MALRINGVAGQSYLVPHVLKSRYKFTAFQETMTFSETPRINVPTPGGATVRPKVTSVNVKARIDAAWAFITGRLVVYKPCNDYFKSLSKQTSLKEVLDAGDITLHCLLPKEGYSFDDLPDADTAGRDIGIDPSLLLSKDPSALACVLVHELAHVAGATTNARDPNAGAAEDALKHCLCVQHYRAGALGLIHRIELMKPGSTRIV